jgi:hypothetical protein
MILTPLTGFETSFKAYGHRNSQPEEIKKKMQNDLLVNGLRRNDDAMANKCLYQIIQLKTLHIQPQC